MTFPVIPQTKRAERLNCGDVLLMPNDNNVLVDNVKVGRDYVHFQFHSRIAAGWRKQLTGCVE